MKAGDAWGRFSSLSLVWASALLIISLSYAASHFEFEWSDNLYWLGLLGLYVPVAARLLIPGISTNERIGFVVLLGMGLYLVKVFYAPLYFQFGDELAHWRSAENISQSGHLLLSNHLLPVAPSYPGLQIVTSALASASGLSIFYCGLILVGAARLVFILALFHLYERISASSYLAGIASVLYMTNPQFLFFNSFYVYQTLALTLAVFVLFWETRMIDFPGKPAFSYKFVSLFGAAAVIVTHHITSYAFILFLILLEIGCLTGRNKKGSTHKPTYLILFSVLFILIWNNFVAVQVIDYLVPTFNQTISDFVQIFSQELSLGQAFHVPQKPLLEQIFSISSVVFVIFLLPFGLFEIWRRHKKTPLSLGLSIGALAYYAVLALRFLPQGAELAGRSWSFVYICVAYVLAAGVTYFIRVRLHHRAFVLCASLLAALLFVGGITNGYPPYWSRLPGAFLATAYERSVEPRGIAAALWSSKHLGFSSKMAADLTNYDLMAAFGGQAPERGVSWIFFSPHFSTQEKDALYEAGIRYIVVDHRLSSRLPELGFYFDPGEPDAYLHQSPIDPGALDKFNHINDLDLIFDDGEIKIYDLKAPVTEP